MNGPHDLGGQMGFGPLAVEADEPVFHDDWERRAFALTLAIAGLGRWNLDMTRQARESIGPANYLGSSYYRIWIEALEQLLGRHLQITPDELRSGRSLAPALGDIRPLSVDRVVAMLAKGGPTLRSVALPPAFPVGQLVRTVNIHPTGHTRLPRYLRGKLGAVHAVHGAHVFPDSHAAGKGEQAQWLYSVRFQAAEVWGPDTSADELMVDCWQSYLRVA